MNLRDKAWFRIAGLCGIVTPAVAFACILLAIKYAPQFSWTENALSDLGVQEGFTATLFNYGLIVSGVMALVLASGLFAFLHKKTLGKVGSFTLMFAMLALIAIGTFPENAGPMHYLASVLFFVLVPAALLVLVWAFAQAGQVKTALYTLLIAVVAIFPWVMQFSLSYVRGLAIPETAAALSASAWTIVMRIMMLREASKTSN